MIFQPKSEGDVSEMLAKNREKLRVIGGASKVQTWRAEPTHTLQLNALSGVTLYEPGALTLVAKAGTKISEITELLAGEGQYLPFEPPNFAGLLGSSGSPTIGGTASANASGPRRVQSGACRDSMIGIRFVDGIGTVVKNGGRVMKNVTGLDLVKLLAGSFGTLGVLTEVAFKVLPRPETSANLILHGCSDDRAIQVMAKALGSPFGVSGAAHLPSRQQTVLRVEGFAESVTSRIVKLQAVLGPTIDCEIDDDPNRVARLWRDIADVALFVDIPGSVWRVSLKPSAAPVFVQSMRQSAIELDVVYDWGGGLVWMNVGAANNAATHSVKMALAKAGGGNATLVRASSDIRASTQPVFQPVDGVVANIEAGLRLKFDPHGVFISDRQCFSSQSNG